MSNVDCLILGGGVIGLSIARELCRAGLRVQIVDRDAPGRSASWAAAGLLPPPSENAGHDPVEQLRWISHHYFPEWAASLSQESGIDVGYRLCGGLYLSRRIGEASALQAAVAQWQMDGVRVEQLTRAQAQHLEPALGLGKDVRCVFRLPGEAQVRPPRLLKALKSTCRQLGAQFTRATGDVSFLSTNQRVEGIKIDDAGIFADQTIVAAGPWSSSLLAQLRLDVPVEPMRGQMVMWKLDRPPTAHIINEGPRYLVCRNDGHVLAGSTVEDVGFDCCTTPEGIDEIVRFAGGLLPILKQTPIRRTWAGLRPSSRDGMPYMGRAKDFANLHVATGHFRSGIHLAPATALIISQLVLGQSTSIEVSSLAPTRT